MRQKAHRAGNEPGHASTVRRPPFFQAGGPSSFFPGPAIQREEKKAPAPGPDPIKKGLTITAEKALAKPEVKAALKGLWDAVPGDARIGLLSYAGVHLGVAYMALAFSPQMRKQLSGVDLAKPLSLIPYFPMDSFKYTLPTKDKPATDFSLAFTFEDYFKLLRTRFPRSPIDNLTFGLDFSSTPGEGLSLTGGKAGLDLLKGALKLRANTFKELNLLDLRMVNRPGETTTRPLRSVPGLPPLDTGPGFQILLSADLVKLFPDLARRLGMAPAQQRQAR